MRVQKKLGTAGEILATPSIEHSGLRGESRFPSRNKAAAFLFAIVQPLCLANVGLGALFIAMYESHQACGDGEDQTPPQWCVSAHFSVLLRVLNNATFGGDHSCDYRQRSHELIHTD